MMIFGRIIQKSLE